MQDNNEWYDPNNVNANNFNETMYGYFNRVLDEAEIDLNDVGYNEDDIHNFKVTFRRSLNYAIDMMTMQDARKYYNK